MRIPSEARRVAVTGIGVVAPCGIGQNAFWEGLQGPVADDERRVNDFDPAQYFDNPKEARRTDRFAQFAFAAAAEALEQAGTIDAAPKASPQEVRLRSATTYVSTTAGMIM